MLNLDNHGNQEAKSEIDHKKFWKKFILIQAGGGFVQNEREELLLILRRGKWDLPKGKLDKGESLEQCAIREVKEETGLVSVKLKKFLLVTYHTYDESGKHFLKESHWFRMTAGGDQQLIPQKSEQITKLQWTAEKEIMMLAKNTYPSILDVIKAGGYKIT